MLFGYHRKELLNKLLQGKRIFSDAMLSINSFNLSVCVSSVQSAYLQFSVTSPRMIESPWPIL